MQAIITTSNIFIKNRLSFVFMSSPLCCKSVIKWISATLYLSIFLDWGYLISQQHCNCFVFLKTQSQTAKGENLS